MAESCIYLPETEQEQQLFFELKKNFGHDKAALIYNKVTGEQFIETYRDSLVLQGNTPTYKSVITNPSVVEFLGEEAILKSINNNQPHLEDTVSNTAILINQAHDYNINPENEGYVAYVDYDENQNLTIKIERRTDENLENATNQYKVQKLNESIAGLLSPIGISIGHLSQEETVVGRVGVTDFNKAVDTANGLATMMAIANNMEGHGALSEEFSHFLIGVYRNETLVNRSINALKDQNTAMKILGDSYEAVYEYYDGDETMIAEEALGQVLRDTLLDNPTSANINTNPMPYKSLLQRCIDYILKFFKKYHPATIDERIAYVQTNMTQLAKEVMQQEKKITKKDIARAQREARFNALSEKMDAQVVALKRIEERDYKDIFLQQELQGKGPDYKKRASVFATNVNKQLNDKIKQGETLAAISNYITLATFDLRKYYNELSGIEDFDMRDRFTVLRNTHYRLQGMMQNIKELKDVTQSAYLTDEAVANQKFVIEDMSGTLAGFEVMDDSPIDNTVDTENMSNEEVANTIIKNSEEWELSEDETFYRNKKTGKKAIRVTQTIRASKHEEGFDKKSPWYTPSTNIGTGVDEFIRDFLNGKIVKENDGVYTVNGKQLDEVYPNATNKALNKLAQDLEDFQNQHKDITFISRDVVADGTITVLDANGRPHQINVVGTLDLLGYDKLGNWYIFDYKTYRTGIDDDKLNKYAQQITLYKNLLEQKYGIHVRDMAVIPINVTYPTPKGAIDKNGKGKAVYKVSKNKPEDYGGKKGNQLIMDGKVYKDANPTLKETIPVTVRKTNASYEDLGGSTAENPIKGMLDALTTLDRLYGEMSNLLNELLPKYTGEFFKSFVGENVKIRETDPITGKLTGRMKTVSIEDMIKNSPKDVTLMEMYLNTAADNPDVFVQIMSKAITDQKHWKRIEVIRVAQEIRALGKKYEKKGITSYDWMFEDDKQHYVMHQVINGRDYSYDQSAYEAAKKEYIESLNEMYGEFPEVGTTQWKEKQRLLEQWLNDNLIVVNTDTGRQVKKNVENFITIPSPTKYPSKYKQFTDTEKEFYEEWMAKKAELDALIPKDATTLNNTIKIRKSGFQRFKDITKGNAWHDLKEYEKAKLLDAYDDDFTYAKGMKGYGGEEVMRLPLFYLHAKDATDITTDAIGSLIAYADMCYNYAAMQNVVSPLEVAKLAAQDRNVVKLRGTEKISEEYSFGNKKIKNPLYVGANSNFLKMIDILLEDKVYGRTMVDNGYWEIGGEKVDKNKFVTQLLKMGSTVQLGFNALAGTANLITGLSMQNIEAAAGEFFNRRELVSADGTFIAEQPEYLLDLGRRIKMGKLALVEEYMDFRQDWSKNIRKEDFANKGWLLRIAFGPLTKYICQDAGDHWLYDRAGIAMMQRYKLKDGDNEISLWDALEVVPIDKNDPELGNKLVLKEGVTKLDGTEFTDADRIALTDRIHYVNKHCFGVYDKESSIAARRTIIGKFLMQYRDFLPAQYRYRFGSRTTNLEKGGEVEGYYRTLYNVGKTLFKEMKNGEVNLSQIWDDLEDFQKANIKRAGKEILNLVTLYVLGSIVMGALKKKDRKLSWMEKAALYMINREKTELGAMVPGTNIGELIQIMKSPAANTSVISDFYNLKTLLWVPNYFDEIQAGNFKGHSSAYRAFMRSPLTVYYRTINRTINIENTQYYKKK